MRIYNRTFIVACWSVAALLMVGGCSGGAKDIPKGPVTLKGSGATAPSVLYTKWVAAYGQDHPGANLQYEPTGSGAGIQALKNQTVDFAGSEIPLTDEEIAMMAVKPLHFPVVVGAVVPVYNVAGVGALKFTGEALAGIFSGRIRKWNDPELTRANPGVTLPAASISVFHRSDASGTT